METLIDLTTRSEFRAGFLAGGIGAIVILGAAVFWRRRPIPWWGVLATAATWLSVSETVGRSVGLGIGLVVLAVAGWVWDRSKAATLLLSLAGAGLIAWRGGLPDELWIRTGAVGSILAIGIALLRFDRADPLGRMVVPMFAITSFGIWATVPETDEARALMGVLVLMAVIAWPWRLSSIGSGGAFALAGLIVWIAAVGGEERYGSIIGAWASTGLILLGLLGSPKLETDRNPIWLVVVHGAVVYVTSRVAGFQEGTRMAAAIATPVLVAAAIGSRAFLASRTHRGESSVEPGR